MPQIYSILSDIEDRIEKIIYSHKVSNARIEMLNPTYMEMGNFGKMQIPRQAKGTNSTPFSYTGA